MTDAEFINTVRLKYGYYWKELANRLDTSVQHVSRVANGKAVLSKKLRFKLQELYWGGSLTDGGKRHYTVTAPPKVSNVGGDKDGI